MRPRTSICISGDDLVPDHVTSLLRLEPTYSRAKGESIERQGKSYGKHPTGVWVLDSPLNAEVSLRQQLEWCLTTLRKIRADAATEFQSLEFTVWLGVFSDSGNAECELSPDMMRELAALDAAVRFDTYCE
jgi:hypothetical protein